MCDFTLGSTWTVTFVDSPYNYDPDLSLLLSLCVFLQNLSMDELMEWKHFPGPLDDDFPDPNLAAASQYITYVFQNITNNSINVTSP